MVDQPDIEAINPDLLPPQIRLFVSLIGMAETIKLLQAFGGLPIKITNTCMFLRGVISDPSIELLISELLNQEISVPKYDKVAIQLRNIAINQAIDAGQSGRSAAREYDLTYRMIKVIKHQPPGDDSTGDLFA